jgi:outer membrane lipoprotein-sorting protein
LKTNNCLLKKSLESDYTPLQEADSLIHCFATAIFFKFSLSKAIYYNHLQRRCTSNLLKYIIISIISLPFFLSGCVKQRVIAEQAADISFRTDVDYLEVIDERFSKLNTFQGKGKLKISNSKKSDSATGIFVIKKPDSIRLESFSVFGQAVFFLASNYDSFSVFIPSENNYYTGQNTLENIKKVLPLDTSIKDFSYYLIGEFRKDEGDNAIVKFLEDRKIYKIYFYGDENKVIYFDPEFSVIKKCVVYDSEEEIKSLITYSEFEDVDGIMLPMHISIKFPRLDARIEVDYDEITLNESIKSKLFVLDTPDDVNIINLDFEQAF